jgi:hypothetical protein
MANSYRLRTKVGVDSYLSVQLDQDFEYLEILSLKILQEQIYTRPCADYGVIVGRLTVNGGYGIPNVKVSIFIPVSEQDKLNPLIYDLYPYEKITDQNADGYRYNLLPYKKSHSAHNPTGTFFDREDVLVSPTLIEVYDKYYKYCASTNTSGDFMIFGVPIGTYTIHADVDLSDIGEFSLAPQDLIRMGIATPGQVAGIKFKASENLNELPQIFSLNKSVEVQPLWGQPEICNLGVNRVDFDLTKETKIQITPTSIFMGSLITGDEVDYQKRNCKPKLNLGDQCSLIAGPGIIQALRQTLYIDPTTGYPGLELYDIEQGGQVIDENGAWMVDVPMNLDYVITNEFGEQIISPDPKVGIPTKGKYRFKIKWAQGDTLSEAIKRGYFLVPNIREYWTDDQDPFFENNGAIQVINSEFLNYSENAALAEKSYSFSTDWNDYPDPEVAIKCDDYFYELTYNKVYTVSQMMDSYNSGALLNRKIAIKHILNSECASENNKFPVNDGQYRFDIIFLLFSILLLVAYIIINVIVIIFHIVGTLLKILGMFIGWILDSIAWVLRKICDFINHVIIDSIRGLGFGALNVAGKCIMFCSDGWYPFDDMAYVTWCNTAADQLEALAERIRNLYKYFERVKIPMLTYPDCELCDCNVNESSPDNNVNAVENDPQIGIQKLITQQLNKNSFLAPITLGLIFNDVTKYIPNLPSATLLIAPVNGPPDPPTIGTTSTTMFYKAQNSKISTILSGIEPNQTLLTTSKTRVPQYTEFGQNIDYNYWSILSQNPVTNTRLSFSLSLPISERMNLFNLKSKYFDENYNNYHGLGVNRIKVTFGSDLNSGPNKFHYDNTLTLLLNNDQLKKLKPGQLLSFQNTNDSSDNNINGLSELNQYGSLSVTGTAINTGTNSNINITYANPNGSGELGVDYLLPQEQGDMYAKFATDIEYFMVITAMTYETFSSMCNPNETEVTLNSRYLGNSSKFEILKTEYGDWDYQASSAFTVNSLGAISDGKKQGVVICVRGVDPNSTKQKNKYDLSWLFGYNTDEEWGKRSQLIIEGNYFLNHPIKGNINSISHSISSNLDPDIYLNEADGTLYHDSFRFKPAFSGNASFSSYTTNLPMYYSSFDKLTQSGVRDGNTNTPNNDFYKPDNLIDTPPFSEAIQNYDGYTNCLPNQTNYFVREFKRQIEIDLSMATSAESGACWPCADCNPTWIITQANTDWNYNNWGYVVKPIPFHMNINAPYNYKVRTYHALTQPPEGLLINLDSGNLASYPGTGSIWNDLIGANNSTLFNSPTYSSSYNGKLQFVNSPTMTGTSFEYATIPNIGTLSNWTVEVWFRLTTSLSTKLTSIITNQFNNSDLNFSIGTNDTSSHNLSVGFYKNGGWQRTPGFAPAVGVWYQVVGTYDGTTVRQYINGAASGGTVTTSLDSQSGGDIRLMRKWSGTIVNSGSSVNFVNGDLSIVKIYNKALPSSDILQSYNNTYARFLNITGATYGTITAVASGYWANIGFGIGDTYITDSLHSHKSYSLVAYSGDTVPTVQPQYSRASTIARIAIRDENTLLVNTKLLYYDRPPNIDIIISKIKILPFKWGEVAIVKLDSYKLPSLNKLNISFWNQDFDVTLPNTLTSPVNFLGESLIDVGFLNSGGNTSFIDFDIEVDYISSGIILMFPVPSYSDMPVGGTALTEGIPVLMFINRAQRYVTGQLSPDTFVNGSVFLPISTFPVDITKITIYNESNLIRSYGVGMDDIVNLYACGYRKTSDSTLYFSVFDMNGGLIKTFGPTSADNVGTNFNGSEILTTDTVISFSLDFNPLLKELIVCWINSDGKIYYKVFNVSIDEYDTGYGIIFMPNITLKTINQIEVTFDSVANGTPSDVILKVNRMTKEIAISWQTLLKGVFTMKFFNLNKTEFSSPLLLPNKYHSQTGTPIFDMGTNYGSPSSFNVTYKDNTAFGISIKNSYSVFINREPLNRGYYSNEFLEGGGVMLLKNKYNTGLNCYNNQTEYLANVGKWGYDGYYYSPTYNKDNVIEIKITEDTSKLIMRSDRLPTSTTENKVDSSYGGNSSFALHTNQYFTAYLLDENGLSFSLGGTPKTPIGFASGQDDAGENFATNALATTTCDGLIPLDCYTTDNNTIGVLPQNNKCFYNNVGTEVTDKILMNGCYITITKIFDTLINGKDFALIYEWRNRLNVNYAACRNVFGHVFRNNWINGTLFAFPIKNDRRFTPVFTNFKKVSPTNPYLTKYGVFFSANYPYSRYCKDTVRLHSKTNEFYYRSSPFLAGDTRQDGAFIGINNPSFGRSRNDKFIKFPTTIMDLGPRSKYLQEIVMSDDLDGYNITNLNKSSFSDVDPLLNLFILSRVVTKEFTFLVTGFFSRGLYIDGDYAQMVSTNSQVGVAPFDEANYGNDTGFTSNPIFYSKVGPTFGVFYDSDLEIRDLVSPRRTLINGDVPNSFCSFNELSNFSQQIPMYQWEIKQTIGLGILNTQTPTSFIFGNETNEWYTGLVKKTTGNTETFFSYKYQSLDRLETQSRFFKTNIETKTNFFKGYIYGVSNGPGTGVTINSSISTWSKNTSTSPSDNNNLVTFGTPFYFYFGLKKGKTAIDLFNKKWVNSENVFI